VNNREHLHKGVQSDPRDFFHEALGVLPSLEDCRWIRFLLLLNTTSMIVSRVESPEQQSKFKNRYNVSKMNLGRRSKTTLRLI
jgi:hypothetical protein